MSDKKANIYIGKELVGFASEPIHLTGREKEINKTQFQINRIHSEALEKAFKRFDIELGNYIRKHLNELGFTFDSDQEFDSFLKTRVTRIETEAHCFYLFLDADKENIYIGSYSDEISYYHNAGKRTIKIG